MHHEPGVPVLRDLHSARRRALAEPDPGQRLQRLRKALLHGVFHRRVRPCPVGPLPGLPHARHPADAGPDRAVRPAAAVGADQHAGGLLGGAGAGDLVI